MSYSHIRLAFGGKSVIPQATVYLRGGERLSGRATLLDKDGNPVTGKTVENAARASVMVDSRGVNYIRPDAIDAILLN